MDTKIKVFEDINKDEISRAGVPGSQLFLDLVLPPESLLEKELRRIGFNSLAKGVIAWRLVEDYPPCLKKKTDIIAKIRFLEYSLFQERFFEPLVLQRERERIQILKSLLGKYDLSIKLHTRFMYISKVSKDELRELVAKVRLCDVQKSL